MPHIRSATLSAYALALPVLALGALAVPSMPAHAATLQVTNCNDSGPGSLRQAVASAANFGDTVDMSALSCNRIVLTSGQIKVAQRRLTIRGPGPDKLTVDGNHASRVFSSSGDNLHLVDLAVANGYLPHRVGGCVYARDALRLDHVDVHDCAVRPLPSDGVTGNAGGGVYAQYDLSIYDSRLFHNSIRYGYGGGAAAGGNIVIERSKIFGNRANHAGGLSGRYAESVKLIQAQITGNTADVQAGGLEVSSAVLIKQSTIANNVALHDTGGIGMDMDGNGINPPKLTIRESTISGNQAPARSAIAMRPGSAHDIAPLALTNSTIAFNQETTTDPNRCKGALSTVLAETPVHADSTIIARSSCSVTTGMDVSLAAGASLEGAHNLVEHASSPVPADTITANPLLAPLDRNGGLTKTHTLMTGSPAIDTGSNPVPDDYDQRGPGFPRVKGVAPDIGAVEDQK